MNIVRPKQTARKAPNVAMDYDDDDGFKAYYPIFSRNHLHIINDQ
jgi:hypothetical protein